MKKLLLASLMLTSIGGFAQTKKVILEDYTGVKCGFCVDGTFKVEQLEAANPTNLIPIAIHTGGYTPSASPLKTAEGDAIDAMAQPSGYPSGAVDRKKYGSNTTVAMNRGSWAAAFNTQSALSAPVSVSIENVVRNNATDYEFDVNVEFTSMPNSGVPLKLQVYVLEDKVEAKNFGTGGNDPMNLLQVSYTTQYGGNGSTSAPVYLSSATNNYYHNNVLRKALGGTWGYSDVIPATPVVNTVYTKHVTFSAKTGATPTGWVTENLEIVAFVAYDGSAANDEKEILNAEEYSLKGTFITNVNNIAKGVEILNAYPNPANANDVIKVQYNIKNSETVTMRVLNLIGQEVATPYVSREVKGGHTIQWKASDYGLTSGIYLVEVSSASGKQVQRVTIR